MKSNKKLIASAIIEALVIQGLKMGISSLPLGYASVWASYGLWHSGHHLSAILIGLVFAGLSLLSTYWIVRSGVAKVVSEVSAYTD